MRTLVVHNSWLYWVGLALMAMVWYPSKWIGIALWLMCKWTVLGSWYLLVWTMESLSWATPRAYRGVLQLAMFRHQVSK